MRLLLCCFATLSIVVKLHICCYYVLTSQQITSSFFKIKLNSHKPNSNGFSYIELYMSVLLCDTTISSYALHIYILYSPQITSNFFKIKTVSKNIPKPKPIVKSNVTISICICSFRYDTTIITHLYTHLLFDTPKFTFSLF